MQRAKFTAAAFVVAPALLLADNLLHPKELEPGNEAEQLRVIAESYERWQIAHMLAFAALLIFAVAILGHIGHSRWLVAIGVTMILLATMLFPLALQLFSDEPPPPGPRVPLAVVQSLVP